MNSLYVEPRGRGWNRPVETPQEQAEQLLVDARNDYAGQWDRIENGFIEIDYPEFAAALAQWAERPELPQPSGPRD